jgi:hypothetical protein
MLAVVLVAQVPPGGIGNSKFRLLCHGRFPRKLLLLIRVACSPPPQFQERFVLLHSYKILGIPWLGG